MHVYVLSVDNGPDLRAFLNPELAMKAYIDHIKERIPGSVNDEELTMETDRGGYTAYWDGEFIAELFYIRVEDE